MGGAGEEHGPVGPRGVHDAVDAGDEGLGQDAGLQRQVVVGRQQEEEHRVQRRTVEGLLPALPVLFHRQDGGAPEPGEAVEPHQQRQEAQIGPRLGVGKGIGQQLVLQDRPHARRQGQQGDGQVQGLAQGGLLPLLQLLELLPGQMGVDVSLVRGAR